MSDPTFILTGALLSTVLQLIRKLVFVCYVHSKLEYEMSARNRLKFMFSTSMPTKHCHKVPENRNI